MRIERQSNKKKITLITLAILILITLSLFLWLYFNQSNNTPSSIEDPKKNNSTSKTDIDKKDDGQTGTDTKNNDTPATTEEDPDYISSPISNPPTDASPYPIQNEHYKIDQLSQTNYRITLYPIANNPDYSDYNAQLKAYKQESLDYLTKRYGDINNFNFEWNPDNAKDI